MQYFEENLISSSQVTVDGPQPTPVQAGVVRAGVCAFTYHAHAAGTYTVTAAIHGIHVRNSPAVVVASIAEACPSQCEVKGTPLTLSTVSRFLMFMVSRYGCSTVAKWVSLHAWNIARLLPGDARPGVTI